LSITLRTQVKELELIIERVKIKRAWTIVFNLCLSKVHKNILYL
jgi:hypothetical protein